MLTCHIFSDCSQILGQVQKLRETDRLMESNAFGPTMQVDLGGVGNLSNEMMFSPFRKFSFMENGLRISSFQFPPKIFNGCPVNPYLWKAFSSLTYSR